MYNQKMVATIKVKGKILREFKDTVYIPYGSEYVISLKNLHTSRAVVNVFIDGDNVVPNGLVLNAGQTVDLERSIKNNNLTEGNRFKFVERTEKIENHRGIGAEDGLVRIEFQYEQPRPVFNISDTIWRHSGVSGSTGDWIRPMSTTYNVNGALRGVDFSNGEATKAAATSAINASLQSMNISASSAVHDGMATMDWCDTGITVPGSKSNQTFQETTVGILEAEKHNIVLRLLGDLGFNKPVEKAVTVKHKPKCVTCGKQNKHNAKFCSECGTALEVFA